MRSSVRLVGVVRPERAATVVGSVGIDALTAGSEDAGPARGEPGQVCSVDHLRIAGIALRIGELQPVPGAAQGHLGHGSRVGRAGWRAVARVRAPADPARHAAARRSRSLSRARQCVGGPRCVLEGRCRPVRLAPVAQRRDPGEPAPTRRRKKAAAPGPEPTAAADPSGTQDPTTIAADAGGGASRDATESPTATDAAVPGDLLPRLGALPASAARPRSQRPARRSTPRRRPGLLGPGPRRPRTGEARHRGSGPPPPHPRISRTRRPPEARRARRPPTMGSVGRGGAEGPPRSSADHSGVDAAAGAQRASEGTAPSESETAVGAPQSEVLEAPVSPVGAAAADATPSTDAADVARRPRIRTAPRKRAHKSAAGGRQRSGRAAGTSGGPRTRGPRGPVHQLGVPGVGRRRLRDRPQAGI